MITVSSSAKIVRWVPLVSKLSCSDQNRVQSGLLVPSVRSASASVCSELARFGHPILIAFFGRDPP